MEIAIISRKGGVGKSLISVMLRDCFSSNGHRAVIRDWDPQGTATKSLRNEPEGLLQDGDDYEVLISDTPPSLSHPATLFAVEHSSIILVVTTPAPVDMWEAEASAEFARRTNPGAVVRLAVNRLKPRTIVGDSLGALLDDQGTPACEVKIHERECYKRAPVLGWGALTKDASAEITELALELAMINNKAVAA